MSTRKIMARTGLGYAEVYQGLVAAGTVFRGPANRPSTASQEWARLRRRDVPPLPPGLRESDFGYRL
ncbi:hypothetical protein ACFC1T_09000 [Kitasatospora sp. NPDC056076]|uniref:hypothetical protein n=1 Tax=Kitasatospora sp. NPDC056076 TaxID=3345703 RepID=UPI0035DEE196